MKQRAGYRLAAPAFALLFIFSSRPAQIENGRFQQAAKMYKEVAEIAEGDGVVDEALKNFKLAAEYYAQVPQLKHCFPLHLLSARFRRCCRLRLVLWSSCALAW
jgi:hypothetical protein